MVFRALAFGAEVRWFIQQSEVSCWMMGNVSVKLHYANIQEEFDFFIRIC